MFAFGERGGKYADINPRDLAHAVRSRAKGNISNFEHSEKYIEFAIGEHIDKKKGLLSNDRQ